MTFAVGGYSDRIEGDGELMAGMIKQRAVAQYVK